MKVVSVINYKGGVGKTTVTANLAGELANRGYKVLMIDLDPQASLTFSFVTPDYWKDNLSDGKTIKTWFTPSSKNKGLEFRDLIFSPNTISSYIDADGALDLVASHLELINVDLELATELGGASMKQTKRNFLKIHRRLVNGINDLKQDDYDLILIDCPPNFNIVTKNAIVASDYILIPAKPDYLSTLGIDYLKRSVDGLIKEYNEFCKVEDDEDIDTIEPEIAGIIFTMVQFYGGQPIAATRPYIAQAKRLKVPVFENYIRENKTLFADAPQYGVPVILSDTVRTDIIVELNDFIDEFITKIL